MNLDERFGENEVAIINAIKVCLLKKYSESILAHFQKKIDYLVNKYVRNLPSHVGVSESEDLQTIAILEFFETIKAWDPRRNADVWPLAYSRINGAMRDHIRYVTKSDPSRFYEWVSDAAHLYLTVNQDNSFESKIESSDQLSRAMARLSPRDKRVVMAYIKEDKTFAEIGEEFDISESHVSRVYKKAIEEIKKSLSSSESE